jgi:hypothetical protein
MMAALRSATLVAAGALAAHELTYLAGVGPEGSHAAADHSYLSAVIPALAVLVALTLLATVERGVAGSGVRSSPLSRILAYGGAIVALFFAQETTEFLVAGADPAQIVALLAHQGLISVTLALCLGAGVWLAVRGLEAVEERIAIRFYRSAARRALRSGPRPRWLDVVLSPALLAGGAAARAPPAI